MACGWRIARIYKGCLIMVEIHYKELNQTMQEKATGTLWEGFENVSETNFTTLLKSNAPPNYISFDGNGINLDNTHTEFLTSGDYVGYISSAISNENCKLSPALEAIHIRCDELLDLTGGITIAFYGDCCRKLTVRYTYPDATNEFETYNVNSSLFHLDCEWFSKKGYSITLMFRETALPYQFLKISYIKFGEVKIFKRLKDVGLIEQLTVLSDDVPVNALDFSIVVDEPMQFKENTIIDIYSNKRYYGTFYLDTAEWIAKKIHSVKALSPIKQLDENEYKEWYTGLGTGEFLEQLKTITDVDVIMPNADFYHVLGPIEANSCRYALCLYAFACGFMIDESRNDGIALKPIPTEIKSVITTASKRILGEATYTQKKPTTQAKIREAYGFDVGNVETIQLTNPANKRTVYYFETPCEVYDQQNDDITVFSSSCNYIDFISTIENTSLKVIKVNYTYNDFTLSNPTATAKKQTTLDLSKLGLKANYFDDTYGDEKSKDIFGQKLNDIIKYMQSGGTVNAKIRLRHEKIGDLIQIETAYDGIKTGIITDMSISFGYEDVAEIEVLEWQIG